MSEARSIGAAAPTPQVHTAILRASQATGVDFSYLLGQARLESSFNPDARAGSSSAAGLYQFTKGTWLVTLDRHGAEHGYGWADAAIQGGRVRDPQMRQQVLALRYDPEASALMAAELASDNRVFLQGVLGRDPDASELYLAHFLGADGAGRFLTALAANPGQSAAALFPDAAGANRAIFFDHDGQPRSLGAVMDLVRGKMTSAMGGAADFAEDAWATSWSPPAALPAHGDASAPAPVQRPSMADTLAAAFGGSAGAMPAHVRQAYGKLQVFGL
ncbi:MAG: transglycosylase SLT domain-containing protein [Sphingomonadaceae bacterium]